MRIQEPIRAVVVSAVCTIAVVGYLVGMPLLPLAALLVVPLIVGIPVEVARHVDAVEQYVTAHGGEDNREPDEPPVDDQEVEGAKSQTPD